LQEAKALPDYSQSQSIGDQLKRQHNPEETVMAEKSKDGAGGKGRTSLKVTATLTSEKGQNTPSARIYLFDRSGKLINSSPAGAAASFAVEPKQDYRVVVGPDLIKDGAAPANLAAQLAKAKAVSQDASAALALDKLTFTIHPPIWRCWFPTCINVHGTVRKLLNPGGSPAQYAPICSGTVQIFEVALDCTLDSFSVVELASFKAKLLQKLGWTGPHLASDAMARTRATTVASRAAVSSASLADLAGTIAAIDGTQLKNFIVSEKASLSFWLCELIPDSAFCWQELTEVPIQSDGSFFSEICFWCPDDLPDLYFEVIQNIGGSTIEISDPQIACSTYYNYDGSQSVDIVVDDPRAIACQPSGPPGPGYLYVWPTAIGNIDLGGIDGLETGLGSGLLPANTPWGGTLCLQMQFHPELQANNIRYYRWSYQFDGDSGPTQIHETVVHRYQTITVSGGVITIHLNPVTLGPQLVSGPSNPAGTPNLFAIPDPTLPWIDINDPADRPFAYFDSTGGVTPYKSGMCTLMLEMFDGDGNFVAANNVRGLSTLGDSASDPGGPGAFTYILPEIGGPPGNYTNAPTPNVTDHGRLIFRVRVDNNMTVAQLPRVGTPLGSTDTDPCGMLHYTTLSDSVDLSYVAFHPNDFLDWDLTISRGISGVAASIPPSPPPTNVSSGSPGTPAHFINTAGALLGPCVQAAFAVNLDCRARAESGYGRQSQYDSFATIAFALIHP
jgi:hypothetical protein